MSNDVFANMMEVSCKSGSGKTICAFPDVCFTPPQTPATPPGVPIPYPNTGLSSDTSDGSSTVKISGQEVMLKNKSYFKKSSGDEAGSAPKKGVVTSKNTGKVYFNAWSMDVKIEGENVVRHLDITTHNHASQPGNSPPMPHTDSMQPGPDGPTSCPVGSSCSVGSPINPILGAKVLAGNEDLDFTVPGPLPLIWQRFYLSTNASVGWFGRGWSSPLELRLEAIPDPSGSQVEQIDYIDHFGRRTTFDFLEPGASLFSSAEKVTLSRTEQGQYRVTGPDGLTHWFADRRGAIYRLAAITDRNSNTIHVDYGEENGRVVHVRCSGGQPLELNFQNGRLVSITELRGNANATQRVVLMRYHFTDRGDLWQVFNRADELLRTFDYTADQLMRRHVYDDFEAEYEYAGTGGDARVVRHWDNVGRYWTFEYGSTYTTVTDQDGRTVRHHFDEKRRQVGITDALGQVARIGLDRYGNVRALIDPAEHVTETWFDERGNPTNIQGADGGVTTVEWDAQRSLPVAATDPLNRTTLFKYDERGNLVSEIDPEGAETRYLHDERGMEIVVINANGGVSRRTYNDQAQLTEYIDCSGSATQYEYDSNGWLIASTNPLGERTRFEYDRAGRLIRQVLPDGAVELYENDIVGRLVAFTDGEGHRTQYRFAPDGQLIQRIDALGRSVLFRYDRARRLIEIVNENQASHRFIYDPLDRPIDMTRFDGTRVVYRYNRAGHLVETIEQPGVPDQIVFRYSRDSVGRLLVRASDRTRAVFEYDAAGQRIAGRTEDPPVDVRMAYDKAGRRIMELTATSDRTFAIRHKYDSLGNRLSTSLPDGTELEVHYYGCGNARQIDLGGVPITQFERDSLHREVARTQGRLTTHRSYDPGGHLERQAVVPAQLLESPPADLSRQFFYDRAGRLVRAQESTRELTYGYDPLDRLTQFNDERYAFDPAGNMVPTTAPGAVIANNRVVSYGANRYRYDTHGRMVEKAIGADAVVLLAWNDDHRLTSSTVRDSRGGRTANYIYDAFGRRIAKRDDEGTTWYLWDTNRLLQEYRGVDEYTFIYEPGSFAPLAQAVVKRADGVVAPRALYYFHCDQVGLPREMTDTNGRLAWAGDFRGWGRALREQTQDPNIAPVALRFQGQNVDAETGLHYNLMRYYDPDIGRYISRDPVGLLGGFNEYLYAPNPVFWIDLFGLTGTYIFTDGTTSYIGKGPKERFQASKAARLGSTCGATAEHHEDFGDDDMGFMVEHLLMEHYGAKASPGFANSDKLNSPGKKKYEAADADTKKKARAKRDAMIKKFEAKKAACP